MSADLASVLTGIVGRHGEGVLAERARLSALLRDHAPGDLRAVRVLMTAYDSGAAFRLHQAKGTASPETLGQETANLVELYGTSPDLARAAVTSWAVFASRGAAGAAAAPARPLPLPPATAGAVKPLPLPGAAPAPNPAKSAFARWAPIVGAGLLLLAGALRLLGAL